MASLHFEKRVSNFIGYVQNLKKKISEKHAIAPYLKLFGKGDAA